LSPSADGETLFRRFFLKRSFAALLLFFAPFAAKEKSE